MSQLTSHNHKIWWKINIQNHLSLQAPGPLASRYSSAMLCIAFFILDRLRGAMSPAVSLVSSCRTIIFTIIYRIREHFHWIFRHFSTVLMTDPDLTSVKIASFQGGISCRRPSWRSQLWAVHREGFNSLRCIKLFNLSTCCWGYLATFENDSRKSPSLPRRSAAVAASKPMLPVYPDLFHSFTLVRNPGKIVLPSTHAVAHAPLIHPNPKTQRPTYLNFQLSSLLQTSCKKHSPAAKMCWQQTGAQFIANYERCCQIALQARHFIGWNYAAVVFFHQQLTFRSFWRRLIPQMFTEKCCRPIEVHALKTRNAITTNGSILHIAGHSKPRKLGGQKSKLGSHHCTTTTTTICSPKLRPAPLVRLLLKVWCMVRFAQKKVWASLNLNGVSFMSEAPLSRTPNSASCFAEEMDHRFHLESSQVDYAWNRFVGSPSSILSVIRYHVTSLQRSGSFSCAKEVNQQKTISQSQAMCRIQLHQPQGMKPRPSKKKLPFPDWKFGFWKKYISGIYKTCHILKLHLSLHCRRDMWYEWMIPWSFDGQKQHCWELQFSTIWDKQTAIRKW